MFGLLKKIFGTAQSRLLKKYGKLVREVNAWEEKYQSLSDDELKAKTTEFKERLRKGEAINDLLPEGYAVVKNQCRRMVGTDVHVSGYEQKWDMVPYDVQILGAIAMHFGSIAEMHTGEGKTLTAAMPLYLNALTGKPVHLVTVNDYLAKRDCEWIGTIFQKLGLKVAYLVNEIPPYKRKEVYEADILYGTASEFGFDYLRDHSMAMHKNELCQRGHYFAIIDEVDSILIDEARTPLIISGPSGVSKQMYDELKEGVSTIVRTQRDLCNKLASDARKILESHGLLSEDENTPKITKDEKLEEAFKKLWLVGKGTPHNKILKRVRENPDLRAKIEYWETYFYSEQNKDDKAKELQQLLIVVDERANEYELTDKGIHAWSELSGKSADDFVMLDLGDEYAKIESSSLSSTEKMQKKIAIREEDGMRKERAHNLRQLFRAHLLMEKDVDYIVQENKIIIIDENTGRPQPGRRFSDGLHQAIEAKEAVAIQGETQTYATITLQNYFRMYEKLAGMTGTGMTEANEFKEVYKLDVIEIPTYKSSQRKDSDDEIYMTEREKYNAILKEIKEVHGKGRPILIGTESVEASEKLARILKQNKLEHTILNAKNHAKEAEIIALAGVQGAITIATNMAGRGTDIKLKGDVSKLGGLHVIGTTRHSSRRIDRQLRGRSGRLGDPGSSKFYISFEDSLMRLFASPRMTALLQRFRPPEGEPISAKVLNKSIETAQKRVEQRNYTMRKYTLEYDDVMNKQRQEVYAFRSDILQSNDLISISKDVLDQILIHTVGEYFVSKGADGKWDPVGFREFLLTHFPVSFEISDFDNDYLDRAQIEEKAANKILEAFDQKIEMQIQRIGLMKPDTQGTEKPMQILGEVIRNLMLRRIDSLWQEHLLSIDHLRNDVFLRTVGQKDPLIEFKQEAFHLFQSFSQKLRLDISRDLFRFEMVRPQAPTPLEETLQKRLQMHREKSFAPVPQEPTTIEAEEVEPAKENPLTSEPKVGRNDNCPCGSNKKYKKCCGSAFFSD